jgi:hypothetical protein
MKMAAELINGLDGLSVAVSASSSYRSRWRKFREKPTVSVVLREKCKEKLAPVQYNFFEFQTHELYSRLPPSGTN